MAMPGKLAALAVATLCFAGASTGAETPGAETLAKGVAHDALFAVAFDGSNGIAVGVPGRILNSADGGKSWAPEAAFPSQLAMLGADLKQGRAIAVGQMGEVFVRTTKGAWTKAAAGTTERLMSVSLNASGRAVAVGAFGAISKSEDHGATWQALTPDWTPFLSEDQLAQGIQPHLFAVQVSDAGVITMAGEFSLILRSEDAGASWTAVNRGDAAIFALDLRADGVGYAVGQDGLVLRSDDAGLTWAPLQAGSKANLLGVRSQGGAVVISAMHDMLSSSNDGASWRHVQSPDIQSGWYSGVGVSGGSFLAVGHAGRIIKVKI